MKINRLPEPLKAALAALVIVVASILLGALAAALTGCNPLPGTTTPDEAQPPIVYEAVAGSESLTLAARPGEWASVVVEGKEVRFRLAADQTFPPPAEANVSDCPCPTFATTDHPEDPAEAPGTYCLAKSRTGQWMDATDHPACKAEALERAGWGR